MTPDRKLVVVSEWEYPSQPGTRQTITMFDADTFKPTRKLSAPNDICGPLKFTLDGKVAIVLGPDHETLHRVDVATWKPLGKLPSDSGWVMRFDLSPDGKQIIVYHFEPRVGKSRTGQGRISLWDSATLRHIRDIRADIALGGSFAFTPDGSVLAVSYRGGSTDGPQEGGVIEYSTASGKELRRGKLAPSTEKGITNVSSMAYSPDGKTLALSGGEAIPVSSNRSMLQGHLYVWDRQKGIVQAALPLNPGDYFGPVLYSANGQRIYLGSQGQLQQSRVNKRTRFLINASKVQCWDANTYFETPWSIDGEFGRVNALLLSPKGTLLIVADDGGLWLLDVVKGQKRGGLITTTRQLQ